MTNSERAFLALSETLNFTRAADKIFITQQGISEHIKKLEEDSKAEGAADPGG